MAATAAHLTNHVIPAAPVCQWVLSAPKRLRYFQYVALLELEHAHEVAYEQTRLYGQLTILLAVIAAGLVTFLLSETYSSIWVNRPGFIGDPQA